MIKKIKFDKFTAFEHLEVVFSPGVNIFIGENGTGKTHIMKAVYAACDITKSKENFSDKINKVFFPSKGQIGRLVKRSSVSSKGSLEIIRSFDNQKDISLRISFSSHTTKNEKTITSGSSAWSQIPLEAVYIPVKDMLANAPGFPALYKTREIHFEEIYIDIITKASIPALKGQPDKQRKQLLETLQQAISGKVIAKNEEFFLHNSHGELEFTLLAEGFRKLGLLWILIQNGTLLNGSALFWDEPEANLNPRMIKIIVGILLNLQKIGVQIFIATHNYIILKEFDLQAGIEDKILYHSLYRNKENDIIKISSTSNYLDIYPNAIDDTFGDIIDREIEKSMGDLGK